MDGRKMFRQTNAKQTNAQTQPRQPNKQMVESEGRRLLPKEQKSSLSSNGNNGEDNVEPTNLARIKIHSVCLYCHK